eukprot:629451-Amphidinium_carterae.1
MEMSYGGESGWRGLVGLIGTGAADSLEAVTDDVAVCFVSVWAPDIMYHVENRSGCTAVQCATHICAWFISLLGLPCSICHCLARCSLLWSPLCATHVTVVQHHHIDFISACPTLPTGSDLCITLLTTCVHHASMSCVDWGAINNSLTCCAPCCSCS